MELLEKETHNSQVLIYIANCHQSESEVAHSCPTLCDPMDCSQPGSSVHGILQARVLKWVAISFSRGSSRIRDQTQLSRIAGRCFNLCLDCQNPLNSYFGQNPLSAHLQFVHFMVCQFYFKKLLQMLNSS